VLANLDKRRSWSRSFRDATDGAEARGVDAMSVPLRRPQN